MFDDSPFPTPSTTPPSSSPSETNNNNPTWQSLKEDGKKHFRNSNYTGALVSFQEALEKMDEEEEDDMRRNNNGQVPSASVDREVLLSNSVACRLKIGGTEMAVVAIEEAKKCIALNDKWSKAHVRLASAYIALGNHSNDACQSLQNAIRLDPTNSTAKQMLTKELRRDRVPTNSTTSTNYTEDDIHVASASASASTSPTSPTSPTYFNENDYTNNNTRPSAPPPSDHNDDIDNNDDHYNDIDDTPTGTPTGSHNFIQRIQHSSQRILQWYRHDASESWKALVQVMVVIFCLYIAFGGRFGVGNSLSNRNHNRYSGSAGGYHGYNNGRGYDSGNAGKMGNYGDGNAYDQFYKNDRRESTYTNRGGSSYDRRSRNNRNRSDSNYDWDAIVPYVLVIGVIIICNKVLIGFGMNRGFGMNIGFGGLFGPRIRLGGLGGYRFGGFNGAIGRVRVRVNF